MPNGDRTTIQEIEAFYKEAVASDLPVDIVRELVREMASRIMADGITVKL